MSGISGGGGGLRNVVEDLSPQWGGDMDFNGFDLVDSTEEMLIFVGAGASAVNEITISNAITGSAPCITASGDDADVDLCLLPKGSGNVTISSLKYPTADGTAGQVLKTDGAGNLSFAVDAGGINNVVEDLSPQLGGQLDANGFCIGDGTLEILCFAETASAVNEFTMTNAATAGAPELSATGDDADIDLDVVAKGTGNVNLSGIAYPNADGAAGQVMETDGAGNLSFVTPVAGLTEIVQDTTPQLGGQLDVNGSAIGDGSRELISFTETALAVNQINVANASTGNPPTISAVGDNANIGLALTAKGTLKVSISGIDYPRVDGTAGQILETDGAGTLSFIDNDAINNVVDDTTPQLGGQLDANGQCIGDGTLEILCFAETASAVNEVTVTNAATAGAPSLAATGDDADIDLALAPKGSGNVTLSGLKYPSADGTVGQILTTDGAGNLAFTADSSGIGSVVEDLTPQLGGQLDANGQCIGDGTLEILCFAETASAVNEFTMTNAATAGAPELSATGDDADIDLDIVAKGTGNINLSGIAYPNADGTNGQVMETDGSGNLSFVTPVAGLTEIVQDTTPQLGGQLDVNGSAIGDGSRELISFTETALAVNQINVANASTGNPPTISAVGDNANIGLALAAKGTLKVSISGIDYPRVDGTIGQILSTDGSGVLSFIDNDSGIESIVEDTTPQLGGQLDVNGQCLGDGTLEILCFTETGSAVNEFTMANAATAGAPQLSATGDDTDIDLDVVAKGTGNINLSGIAYPNADGTVGQILSTNGSGALSFIDNDSGIDSIVEDTTPQLGGQLDVNGQCLGDGTLELLCFIEVASAVNEFTMRNAATGNAPQLSPTGGDTDIDMALVAKGTGRVSISALKYPNADGTAGQLMQTDGAGNLSFVTSSAIDSVVEDTTPQLGGQLDVNGQCLGDGTLELLCFTEVASAVNEFTIRNAATAGAPRFSVTGGDVDIDLDMVAKGMGNIVLSGISFPNADGAAGQIMETDGAGNLSFVTPTTGIANVVEDTTPQLGGMLDINGNCLGDGTLEILCFVETASAINEFTMTNAATGTGPTLSATGDDAAIDLNIAAKGAGNVVISGLDYPNADGAAGQILSTDGAGTLSFVADAGLTAVVQDTTPQLGGMLDVNGNALGDGTLELIKFAEAASAVNEITVTNAATGGSPSITATGDDADIDLDLAAKGSGNVSISNILYPSADGTIGQIMETDGSGNLSFVTPASGGLQDVVDDTTPQLGGMLDVNGFAIGDGTRELLSFVEHPAGVNQITVYNSSTTNPLRLVADGDDANVSFGIESKGSGAISLDSIQYPTADGTNGQALITNGSAVLSFGSVPINIVEDTTPQLGGMLDVNGFAIGNGSRELIKFIEASTAVNEITITNANNGVAPTIAASGDNPNIRLKLAAKGTERVAISNLTYPNADGSAGQVLTTTGGGVINFATPSGLNNIVEDTTPQLGGNLDIQTFNLGDGTNAILAFIDAASPVNHISIGHAATGVSPFMQSTGANADIDFTITPKGSGNVVLDGLSYPNADGAASQFLQTDGAGNLSFAAATGDGKLIGFARGSAQASVSTTTVIPADGTFPQNTEGVLLLTVAYTPVQDNSDIVVQGFAKNINTGGSSSAAIVTLNRSTTANSLDVSLATPGDQDDAADLGLINVEGSGHGTGARNYTLRFGSDDGTTVYLGTDTGSTAQFGTLDNYSIIIMEWDTA